MQYDAATEFQRLHEEVKNLEAAHPGAAVQVFVAPVSAGVSPGNRAAPVEQADLHRVTLKTGAGEVWVTMRERGDTRLVQPRPWNPSSMHVEVTGTPRAPDWGPVSFTQEP